MRIPVDVLAKVDAMAATIGTTRAALIRGAVIAMTDEWHVNGVAATAAGRS